MIRVLSRPAWVDRMMLRVLISRVESSALECKTDEATYRIPVINQKAHAAYLSEEPNPVSFDRSEVALRIRRRCARCDGPCRNKKECDDRMVANAARVLSTRL